MAPLSRKPQKKKRRRTGASQQHQNSVGRDARVIADSDDDGSNAEIVSDDDGSNAEIVSDGDGSNAEIVSDGDGSNAEIVPVRGKRKSARQTKPTASSRTGKQAIDASAHTAGPPSTRRSARIAKRPVSEEEDTLDAMPAERRLVDESSEDDFVPGSDDEEPDDEVVQGSDGEEADNIVVAAPGVNEVNTDTLDESLFLSGDDLPPIEYDDEGVTAWFEVKLRHLLEELQAWATRTSKREWDALKEQERPMTFGFWGLLRKVSIEFLLKLYVPATPLEVQSLLSLDSWSVEDFLALPDVGQDGRKGIYANFPTGDLSHEQGCDAYVGETEMKSGLKGRADQHQKRADKRLDQLTPSEQRALHYRQICRDGVDCHFKKLASFKKGRALPQGLLKLLEASWMIILGTHKDLGGPRHAYVTAAAYDMVSSVREKLNLPVVDWRGMNGAWSLRQGFWNRAARTPSACRNPACMEMTFPKKLRPTGRNSKRALVEAENLFSGYHCNSCYIWQRRYGRLPQQAERDKCRNFARKKATTVQAHKQADENTPCADCGVLGFQMYQKFRTDERHGSLLFCITCWHTLQRKGRRKTPAEVAATYKCRDERETWSQIEQAAPGAVKSCTNCGTTTGKIGPHAQSGRVLCHPCKLWYKNHNGEMRDPVMRQGALEHKQHARAARKAGLPVICCDCSVAEEKDARRKHIAGEDGLLCDRCYQRRRK